MIEKETVERIKQGVDLKDLIESKGIQLKKNGKGWFGRCPFHHDKTPSLSVTPSKNQWHCFGCGAGGDVIRFVELFDGVDFKEAVRRLTGKEQTAVKNKMAPTPQHQAKHDLKLFNRVIEFYHTAFTEDNRAKQYLEQRGVTGPDLFTNFNIGFANGTLLNVLDQDTDTKKQLKDMGILNGKGHEHFYGCVTFPLYDPDGNPAGMYGRRIDDMSKGADHLYLAGERKGVFNWQCVKTHKEIILTESILDSLTLINAGIHNTIPCYGTNGLTHDHLGLFKQYRPEKIFICFDGDEPGKNAVPVISERLNHAGVTSHPVVLPDGQDINEFFLLTAGRSTPERSTADAAQAFKTLVADADPDKPSANDTPDRDGCRVTPAPYGFIMETDNRRYEIRGISKRDNKLKATVKGITDQNRMHVDTVDFYSARSRNFLIKGLCDLFGTKEGVIKKDLDDLLGRAEHFTLQQSPEQDPKQEMSPKDKTDALAFLKSPQMFDEILRDFETLGYTGEEMNKLLCYIACVSRKMESPLSVMIQSRSAAGKSYLQDTVLSLVPDTGFVKYTRLTDQALFYTGSCALKNKILAIEELDGMNGAIYSIRSIQSSKEITIAYTGKDAATGEQKTLENKVKGPIMVFITTTQVDIDGETASRFVFISIDESEAMTRKVLAKQRLSHTMEGMLNKLRSADIIKKHHNASALLKPLHVFNPYAELLTFTSKSLRARRDHTKYLNLILAVAFLFQHQRKIQTMAYNGNTLEYINVTLEDIEKANTIAGYVLGRTLDELPPPSRALLKLIQDMVRQKSPPESEPCHFTRREIREFSGWSDFQVKTHIRQLEELEYLYAVMGKKGKEYVYELMVTDPVKEDQPFLIGLTDIRQLRKKAKELGIEDHLEG